MQRDGIAVEGALGEKPELQANLVCYMEAFYDLDTERHHGMGFMRIPWSRIVYYARFNGMPLDETIHFIRHMDDAHIAELAKASKNGGSARPGEVVQRPPRPN